jgi:DNA-binding MarR family transcriptional regulator
LLRLVNRVAHRHGASLAVMQEAALTLPQVLLLSRVAEGHARIPSELAAVSGGSLPAVSQMIERLVRQQYLARGEDPTDRRRKTLSATPAAQAVLLRLAAARAAEYGEGLAPLSAERLRALAAVLEAVLAELGRDTAFAGSSAPGGGDP